MVRTNPLQIIPVNNLPERIVAIHPNDGDDLNLYTRENPFVLLAGKSINDFTEPNSEALLGDGELHLLNECRLGTLMISTELHKQLSFSDNVILVRNKDKLFLTLK